MLHLRRAPPAMPATRRWGGWSSALLTVTLMYAPAGLAQIYGFVDGEGVAHFAAEPIDERYKRVGSGQLPGPLQAAGGKTSQRSTGHLQRHPGLLKYEALLQRAADEFKLDPALLKAVAAAESGFDAQAVSPKGAIGLMQVMPATAERFGLAPRPGVSLVQRLMDPETNVRLSARYLAELSRMFRGEPALVIAAYNAGEGAVRRYGNAVPPYDETQGYVALVSQLHALFGGIRSDRPGQLRTSVRQNDAPARIRLTIPVTNRQS